MVPGGINVFIFLKSCKKHEEIYGTEAICGPQSLKYLLLGSLQKSLLTTVPQRKAQVVQIQAMVLLNKNCLYSNQSVEKVKRKNVINIR